MTITVFAVHKLTKDFAQMIVNLPCEPSKQKKNIVTKNLTGRFSSYATFNLLSFPFRLQTGWSIKTNQFSQYPKPQPLSEREQQIIVSVVKKAEEMDMVEQKRVGYVLTLWLTVIK